MTTRSSNNRYHHGDLANALVDAATTLAREGGPDAVVLREAARRVGVTSAAAYNHFANHEELIQAVKERSLSILTGEMSTAVERTSDQNTPVRKGERRTAAETARWRLRAIGMAYLGFAFEEPGLFRLTFGHRGSWPAGAATRSPHGDAGAGSFRILAQALDEMVTAGAIPSERREGLDYVAWAGVHGFAVLCLDGPLAQLGPKERHQMAERALDTIVRGL